MQLAVTVGLPNDCSGTGFVAANEGVAKLTANKPAVTTDMAAHARMGRARNGFDWVRITLLTP